MTIDWEKLRAPFAPDEIHWRVGSKTKDNTKGLALAYIDARDVMSRLDAVVGPADWQDEYQFIGEVIVCRIGIRVVDDWVWKTDGAGKTQIEAEKGGISDAFKRAAVKWGIGRHLYDIDAPWVPIEAFGRTYRITKDGLAWLRSGAATEPPVAQGPQKRGKKEEPKPPAEQPAANGGGKTINQKQIALLHKHASDRLAELTLDPKEHGVTSKDVLDGLKVKAKFSSIKEMPSNWMDRALAYIDKWEPGQ